LKVWLDIGTAEPGWEQARELVNRLLEKGWKLQKDLQYMEAQGATTASSLAARVEPGATVFVSSKIEFSPPYRGTGGGFGCNGSGGGVGVGGVGWAVMGFLASGLLRESSLLQPLAVNLINANGAPNESQSFWYEKLRARGDQVSSRGDSG